MSPENSNTQKRVGVIMVGAFDTERHERCGRLLGYIFPRAGEGPPARKECVRAGRAKCLGFFTIGGATKS